MKNYALGVDIGGSHISCAVIDLINNVIVKGSEAERDVDNKAEVVEILSEWSLAIAESAKSIGFDNIAGIGFAMPGPFLYDKGIAKFDSSVAKFEKLYDVDVASELIKILSVNGQTPLRFMNDASAFAVGEAWLGKGAKTNKSVSITLGTGFGSAFIKDGLPVVEGEGVPKMGCVWHLPFEKGIGDDYFSTRWFVKEWELISGKEVKGVKSIAEISKVDDRAIELFVKFGNNLGTFLGPWLRDFGAEILIIGGNVSGAHNLFGDAMLAKLNSMGVNVSVEISDLKENAANILRRFYLYYQKCN